MHTTPPLPQLPLLDCASRCCVAWPSRRRSRSQEDRELAERATKSHRQRIDEMNEKLAKMPVHNDVPKVAAAGLG